MEVRRGAPRRSPRGCRLDGRRGDAAVERARTRAAGRFSSAVRQGRIVQSDGKLQGAGDVGGHHARQGAWARRRSSCPRRATRAERRPPMRRGPVYRCFVFMPEDTPTSNVVEAVVAGPSVVLVKGLINDCGKFVRQGVRTVRLVRPVDAERAVSRRGQEDDGLRAGLRFRRRGGERPIDAARRHLLSDRRRDRPDRHVEGVRRNAASRLDRRASGPEWWPSRPKTVRRSSAPSSRG